LYFILYATYVNDYKEIIGYHHIYDPK